MVQARDAAQLAVVSGQLVARAVALGEHREQQLQDVNGLQMNHGAAQHGGHGRVHSIMEPCGEVKTRKGAWAVESTVAPAVEYSERDPPKSPLRNIMKGENGRLYCKCIVIAASEYSERDPP